MDQLKEYLNTLRKEMNVVSIAAAISHQDKINFFSSDTANISDQIKIEASSIFDIASIGKLFTATAIFILIEKKYFSLETFISKLLNDIPLCWSAVKVKHLLSHSSGIKNYTDTKLYWKETTKDVSKSRIISYIQSEPLEFEPGTKYKYSNTGFYLLGLIIEKVTQQGFFEFIHIEILDRLGLKNIIPTNNRASHPYKVIGYRAKGDNDFEAVEYYSNAGTFAAGGFSCSLVDFLRFEKALFEGRILLKENVQLLQTSYKNSIGNTIGVNNENFTFEMGYGLFIFNKDGKKAVGHPGDIKGFTSTYMRVLEDDFAIIISTNTESKPFIHQLAGDIYTKWKGQ